MRNTAYSQKDRNIENTLTIKRRKTNWIWWNLA